MPSEAESSSQAINPDSGTLDLDAIFQTTTKEVCQLIEADRVAFIASPPTGMVTLWLNVTLAG